MSRKILVSQNEFKISIFLPGQARKKTFQQRIVTSAGGRNQAKMHTHPLKYGDGYVACRYVFIVRG